MAKPANDVLRFVVFQDDSIWIAQGLEHDICTQAGDLTSLRARVSETLDAELDHAREHADGTLNAISRAPEHFFQMWNERSGFSVQLEGSSDGRVELALCA